MTPDSPAPQAPQDGGYDEWGNLVPPQESNETLPAPTSAPKWPRFLNVNTIGLSLTVLAIPASVMFAAWWTKLELSSTSSTPRYVVSGGLPGVVRVTVNGQDVRNVAVTTLQLENTGRKEITPEMFAKGDPIRVRLGQACRILQAPEVKANLPDVLARAKVTRGAAGELHIAPMLLNAGDRLDVTVLTSDCAPSVSTVASIAGIRQIRTAPRASSTIVALNWLLWGSLVVSAAILGAAWRQREAVRRLPKSMRSVLLQVVTLAMLLPLMFAFMRIMFSIPAMKF